jgi:hypothetical protein
MKQITLIFGLLTTVMCSDTLISCPTCIGMPKKGSRPYFERHGIRYVLPQPSKQTNEAKPLSNTPKSHSTPQPDPLRSDQH